MFNLLKSNPILVRNCLIVYLLVGILANIFAESHRSFQESNQYLNADRFSRVISLGLAYHAKNSFDAQ